MTPNHVPDDQASKPTQERRPLDLKDFFSANEARLDRWRALLRVARSLADRPVDEAAATLRSRAEELLAELGPLEAFFGYPGPTLMTALHDRLTVGDGAGFALLCQKISAALLARSYRHSADSWETRDEGEAHMPDRLPSALNGADNAKPYFETLVVVPSDRALWPEIRNGMRRLRRPLDEFIYEPVVVGSFEDALLGVILNGGVQSVILYDGFPFRSHHQLPLLHEHLARALRITDSAMEQGSGTALARLIKRLRPELDVFLLTDREVEKLAGQDEAACVRRVFYDAEEGLEIHLAILEGVADRYRTPFFDNLKHYAQRPIGTFHALPIARGKSIFKSNWISDMGEFYGVNLFLAESSATTGGLDSLLDPVGNVKDAQDAAARAFGADRAYFVTNGTSTANKIAHQAIVRPGDIVLIDRDCHKSHHYGLVLTGGQPHYIDAFPLTQYSMYGGIAIRAIKQALLALKAEGKLDKVRMLVLTNCTFDGHVAHVKRTMEECLAIKPDLVFLWDEAWFGFARFSPFLRGRTAMGAAAALREQLRDPAYRKRHEEQQAEIAGLADDDPRLLDLHLLPDPARTTVRVYQTNSIHKSMSCLRQGSIVLVADDAFHTTEEAFHEAFYTHTSTSPNLQIIASIDVARRQMELEGYELVQRAIQLSLELRREINAHPLISRYFRALTPEEMIPAEFRGTGFADYGSPHGTWREAVQALREDEFVLDPTRVTVLCGTAGYDGTQFKGILADEHDIQINKTSRNSVLVQININNTRSDLAHLIKALADMARAIDRRLETGGEAEHTAFHARVKALMEDVPDLPNFSRIHDAFRDDPASATAEGHLREAYYAAYDGGSCEHVPLNSPEIDRRLDSGPELVSANFVIPYPPGFPLMVPGQVITREIVTFMRKLDVKEIHGYTAALGLKLLKPEALRRAQVRDLAA
ncbi:ornithine decarboxylase [Azospirillum doebereinerae]